MQKQEKKSLKHEAYLWHPLFKFRLKKEVYVSFDYCTSNN